MREDARQTVGAPGGDPLLGEALGKVSGDGRAAHAFQNSSDVALALCDASLTSFRTTDAQRDAVLARLTLDFSRSQVIELRASMLAIVPELVVRHPLRGYDAVQLAAALHVRASGNSVELWSTDETLRVAALAPREVSRREPLGHRCCRGSWCAVTGVARRRGGPIRSCGESSRTGRGRTWRW